MTSARAKHILAHRNIVDEEWVPKQCANPYDPELNPKGIINLCVAENKLCEDILTKKISESLPKDVNSEWLYYATYSWGTERFRQALCGVLNNFFNPCQTIQADRVIAVAGAVSVTNMLSMSIADPGDCILCLTPYYYRIRQDIYDEAGVRFYDVPMIQRSHFKNSECNGADQIEKYYLQATSEGLTVKGLFFNNPDNPSGKVYTKTEVVDILNVCKRYNLHVIVDEIYALTNHSTELFTSVLSMDELPDPERTHFMWGLSKDFCMNGYRCGVMYTENNDVLDCVKVLSNFHTVPVQIQEILTNVLSDTDWIRNTWLPTNKQRLQKAYKTTTETLDELKIPHYKGSAGFFIWADFSQFLTTDTSEEEFELFKDFAAEGILLYPGTKFFTSEPGCFRIIFTVPYQHLIEGLKKIRIVCKRKLDIK